MDIVINTLGKKLYSWKNSAFKKEICICIAINKTKHLNWFKTKKQKIKEQWNCNMWLYLRYTKQKVKQIFRKWWKFSCFLLLLLSRTLICLLHCFYTFSTSLKYAVAIKKQWTLFAIIIEKNFNVFFPIGIKFWCVWYRYRKVIGNNTFLITQKCFGKAIGS